MRQATAVSVPQPLPSRHLARSRSRPRTRIRPQGRSLTRLALRRTSDLEGRAPGPPARPASGRLRPQSLRCPQGEGRGAAEGADVHPELGRGHSSRRDGPAVFWSCRRQPRATDPKILIPAGWETEARGALGADKEVSKEQDPTWDLQAKSSLSFPKHQLAHSLGAGGHAGGPGVRAAAAGDAEGADAGGRLTGCALSPAPGRGLRAPGHGSLEMT